MQNPCTLQIAYDLFILECQSRRFTAHTLRFYRGRLSLFLRWCESNDIELLDRLTAHDIRRYLVSVQQSGVSSAYEHSIARAIRAFLNYCVRDDLIEVSPFDKVKMPRLEKKVNPDLAAADIKRILYCCESGRDRAIIMFFVDSGVRLSEMRTLNVADLDIKSGCVHVRSGKGQKDRLTYIGATTLKSVRRYWIKERPGICDSEAIFTTARGNRRFKPEGLKQVLRKLSEHSGVKFSAHALRRTFAIRCLRSGMNIYVLAKLMGHSDITVLRQYLTIVESDLEEAHKLAGVIDNL